MRIIKRGELQDDDGEAPKLLEGQDLSFEPLMVISLRVQQAISHGDRWDPWRQTDLGEVSLPLCSSLSSSNHGNNNLEKHKAERSELWTM